MDGELLVKDALRTEPDDYTACLERLHDVKILRLLHVSMGLVTEAAEIMDQMKKYIIYGKPLDDARIISDLGDGSWYERIGCSVMGVSLEEMMQRNVRELKVRFPDKFTEHNAINRDEEAEKQAAIR